MKKAYICSPYRGDVARNIAYAKALTRTAIANRYAPITLHLYITQYLNDRIPEERAVGMNVGIALLEVCEVVIVGTDYGISEGMRNEIKMAKEKGIQILFVSERASNGIRECKKLLHSIKNKNVDCRKNHI